MSSVPSAMDTRTYKFSSRIHLIGICNVFSLSCPTLLIQWNCKKDWWVFTKPVIPWFTVLCDMSTKHHIGVTSWMFYRHELPNIYERLNIQTWASGGLGITDPSNHTTDPWLFAMECLLNNRLSYTAIYNLIFSCIKKWRLLYEISRPGSGSCRLKSLDSKPFNR